jgi:two-component system cell cycle response regulator
MTSQLCQMAWRLRNSSVSRMVRASRYWIGRCRNWTAQGFAVKFARKKIKVYVYMILLTSKGLKTDIVTGLGSGADDYLTKPFDSGELKARLRTGQRILHLEGRLVEARENMRFKASHDALTSLFNRGVIMELLGREISRSRRERVPTAILLCDVDHFKSVNDTHGHLIGDEVLREAATRLLLSVRSYDYVGRYGGEEFLIILNNCDPVSAPRRAEEIRRSLSDTPVHTSVGPLLVTMSMGVHQTANWGVQSVEELLHQVDGAMYAAKAAGRNRLSFTIPSDAHPCGAFGNGTIFALISKSLAWPLLIARFQMSLFFPCN